MPVTLQDLILSARELPPVPLHEAAEYLARSESLVQKVNAAMSGFPDIHELIGHTPFQVMYDNHAHHAAFMSAVFSIRDYELLARTIPWVYRSYHAHRFSYDYFTRELTTWIHVLKSRPDTSLDTIIRVYEWMTDHHETMIRLSESDQTLVLPVSDDWLEQKNAFQAALLRGDHVACLSIANAILEEHRGLDALYLHIIQPVMYEIGILWERARITVAHEHLASAIVSRVMSAVASHYNLSQSNHRKAVITTVPHEFHEIGAWMIADMLIQDGWEVRYLGANTPQEALLDLLVEFRPDLLGLSVTMPFNIDRARTIIAAVKSRNDLQTITVCVGGRVFCEFPNLGASIGADHCMSSANDILQLFQRPLP